MKTVWNCNGLKLNGLEVALLKGQEFLSTMEYIIQAMREKGYDPYQQLRGYLLENEPGYITRYKDARTLIQTLDKEQVEQYLAQYEKKE